MDQTVPFVVLAGMLTVLGGGLGWLASRARRRGVGRAVMGPLDEIYNPAAHRSHIEIRVQAERQAPLPAPGDGSGPGGAGHPVELADRLDAYRAERPGAGAAGRD